MSDTQKEIFLPKRHQNQQKVTDEADRFNVLNCGRRWGKSVLSINLIAETAIHGNPSGYFAPTYKLLEGTFREAIQCLEPIVSRKHDNQFIELSTGGIIEFWSLENPFAGRSRKYKRVIVDEGAFVKNLLESWNTAIRPTLTDLIGDAWFMSTPRGKNDFHTLHNRGQSGEKFWKSWTMPTHTNPYISRSEIEEARLGLPEEAYNQEYLAIFSENAANPFGFKHIQNCIKPLSNGTPVCFGIDLAKSVDWTVVTGLDSDGQICFFERWQSDWSQTRAKIIQIVGSKPAYIDSTGVGDPIAEDVQKSCRQVENYHFTSTSKQQIMEGLASAIQKGHISILEGVMRAELESFEYEYTRTGVKYISQSGMHDDTVCSLALAYHKFKNRAGGGPAELNVFNSDTVIKYVDKRRKQGNNYGFTIN